MAVRRAVTFRSGNTKRLSRVGVLGLRVQIPAIATTKIKRIKPMKHHKIDNKTPNQKPLKPLCWECPNSITEPVEKGVTQFIGCTNRPRIKTYADAIKYCPDLIRKKR